MVPQSLFGIENAITFKAVIYTIVTDAPLNGRIKKGVSTPMKRSGWVSGSARTGTARRKGRSSRRIVDQILRDSYRLYARDRVTRKAVKACLG